MPRRLPLEGWCRCPRRGAHPGSSSVTLTHELAASHRRQLRIGDGWLSVRSCSVTTGRPKPTSTPACRQAVSPITEPFAALATRCAATSDNVSSCGSCRGEMCPAKSSENQCVQLPLSRAGSGAIGAALFDDRRVRIQRAGDRTSSAVDASGAIAARDQIRRWVVHRRRHAVGRINRRVEAVRSVTGTRRKRGLARPGRPTNPASAKCDGGGSECAGNQAHNR